MRKMILNNSFSIYHDLKIESSIERVYDAISNPKHLVNWWPLKCDGILKKNEIYNFYFGEEYNYSIFKKRIKNEKSIIQNSFFTFYCLQESFFQHLILGHNYMGISDEEG